MQGLALGLKFAAQPAGSEGCVGAVVQGGEELVGFFDRGGEVGVGEGAEFRRRRAACRCGR